MWGLYGGYREYMREVYGRCTQGINFIFGIFVVDMQGIYEGYKWQI